MDDDLQAYLDKHESEGDKAMEGPDKNFENAKQHYAKYLKKANGKLEVDNEDLMWVKKNYSEALMNLTLVEEADEIHKELLAQFPKNILVQFPDDRKESMIGLVKDILYLRSFRAMTLHAHNKLPEVAQAEQVLKQALRDSKRILGKKDGPEKSETTRELDRNLEVVKNTLKRLQYEDLLSQKQHGGPTSPGNEPPSFPFRQTREVRPSTSDAEESSASAANTSSRDISFKATKQPVSVEFDIVSQPSSSKEEQRGRLPKISDAHLLTGTREVYDK
jgi:tetratricopeptide (TPR) repeat protein